MTAKPCAATVSGYVNTFNNVDSVTEPAVLQTSATLEHVAQPMFSHLENPVELV